MLAQISKVKTNSPRHVLPNQSISIREARERLNEEFGDVVSVHKAF